MVKELVPIVCAAALWGPSWAGQHVLCYCDNMSVVASITKGSSREPTGIAMHLLRTLTFFAASFGFVLKARHVGGSANGPADSISRNNLSSFFSQVPSASTAATQIPDNLWRLLVLEQPDWLSERWRTLLFFLQNSLAASTQKCYQSGQRRFLSFCQQVNLDPLPASEHTIALLTVS